MKAVEFNGFDLPNGRVMSPGEPGAGPVADEVPGSDLVAV
jgi:hypothetical protein